MGLFCDVLSLLQRSLRMKSRMKKKNNKLFESLRGTDTYRDLFKSFTADIGPKRKILRVHKRLSDACD